jgi:peptidoglycan/xylan/chitin deacetylase (PgdA/CDA1 family)
LVAAALAMIAAGCSGQPTAGSSAVASASPTGTGPAPLATTPADGPVEAAARLTQTATPAPLDLAGTAEDFPVRKYPRSVTVPILLYHHISIETPPVRYTIAVQRFEEQLDYLVAHDYETITMQDLVDAIRIGMPLPSRPVMLTFDDGNQDLFELAFPRMQARGMVGVAYVVGNRIGVEGFLDVESLQALREAGWEIGSHGMTHRALADLNAKEVAVEVVDSKRVIETALGEPIYSFAYPFGIVSEESLLAVLDAGYTSGAGLGLWNEHRPDGLFYLTRREVHGTFGMEQFAGLLGMD